MPDAYQHNLNNPKNRPPRKRISAKHLYVMEMTVLDWTFTKVGRSKAPPARAKGLGRNIPWTVRLIKEYPNAGNLEPKILNHLRSKGFQNVGNSKEWFESDHYEIRKYVECWLVRSAIKENTKVNETREQARSWEEQNNIAREFNQGYKEGEDSRDEEVLALQEEISSLEDEVEFLKKRLEEKHDVEEELEEIKEAIRGSFSEIDVAKEELEVAELDYVETFNFWKEKIQEAVRKRVEPLEKQQAIWVEKTRTLDSLGTSPELEAAIEAELFAKASPPAIDMGVS